MSISGNVASIYPSVFFFLISILLVFHSCDPLEIDPDLTDLRNIHPNDSLPEDRVRDINGNIYRTVKIGEQTWMAENLKVTRYPDGTPIPHVRDHHEWFELNRESEGYCTYENVYANGNTFGALYTWKTATWRMDSSDLVPSGVQGVCPDGWHLPSDGEWKQLERYLGMSKEEVEMENWRGTVEGGLLKKPGTGYWRSPNSGATGESGFNALPGGYRHGSGEFIGLGETARFWSASKQCYSYGWFRSFDFDKASVNRDFEGVYRGHSVRCIKDAE